jgi:hypothetical protein
VTPTGLPSDHFKSVATERVFNLDEPEVAIKAALLVDPVANRQGIAPQQVLESAHAIVASKRLRRWSKEFLRSVQVVDTHEDRAGLIRAPATENGADTINLALPEIG